MLQSMIKSFNCALLSMGFIAPLAFAELVELNEGELSLFRGQAATPSVASYAEASASQTNSSQTSSSQNQAAQSGLGPVSAQDAAVPSAGITLDIDLQMHIDEIRWVDVDGAGPNGTQGAVSIRGLSVGHLDDINNPAPAQIRGVTFDVDGRDGLTIGIEQIGDTQGNGIDLYIESVQLR